MSISITVEPQHVWKRLADYPRVPGDTFLDKHGNLVIITNEMTTAVIIAPPNVHTFQIGSSSTLYRRVNIDIKTSDAQ